MLWPGPHKSTDFCAGRRVSLLPLGGKNATSAAIAGQANAYFSPVAGRSVANVEKCKKPAGEGVG